MVFNLSLDLGGDSLKITYAYKTESDQVKYGKITASDSLVRVAFPAIAFFDDESEEWIYGDMVDRQQNASFVKVVKIKDLLSLLQRESNASYYDANEFPKFFFPRHAETFSNFESAVLEGKTFSTDLTPREVCNNFFCYTKTVVDRGMRRIEEENGIEFDDEINIAVIHPPNATKAYIGELVRLVTEAFDVKPTKVLSSTKALGTYVKHIKKISAEQSLLIFDMGEEDISVSKMIVDKNGEILVDGIEGHMEPLHLGGINVDCAIAEYVENEIHERDTVGTPSVDSKKSGHIYEDALVTKQYLFMKGIKKAKVILSRPLDEESVFLHGAPIGIFYELFIQRILTQEEIAKSIGTAEDKGLAREILNYIIEELRKPLNSNLTSDIETVMRDPLYDFGFVVLAGGLSDTFSLRKYIETHLKRTFPNLAVLNLAEEEEGENASDILPNESAAYAASVGGALVALYDEDVKTMLSYSYGTWVNVNGVRHLDIFIDRGCILSNHNAFTIEYSFSGTVEGERLYSTVVTRKDIENGNFRGRPIDVTTVESGKRYLRIGDEKDDYRRSVQDLIKLQTVAGGDSATICCCYEGTELVRLCEAYTNRDDRIFVRQGIDVDDNGRICPTYSVHPREAEHRLRVYTKDGVRYESVAAMDIEIRGPQISVATSQS